MAREKKNAAKAEERGGGGGAAGMKERTESKIGTQCIVCRVQFTSNKMKAQLKEHWETSHSKLTFAECFPNDTL